MCDEWMPNLQYRLGPEEYLSLPRNPAYRYEYSNGTVSLTPYARHFHAELNLATLPPAPPVRDELHIRPMRPADREPLQRIFAWSFDGVQPFGSLTEEKRLEAAEACLKKTWTHGDGPWVDDASFVAALEENDYPVGAIFITLLPGGDPAAWDSYRWIGPPPPDCVRVRAGQPHLTWIFVGPVYGKRGLGSALLAAAGQRLAEFGYAKLWTTFLDGNVSSMLWHWRNGFQLLAHPGSRRKG